MVLNITDTQCGKIIDKNKIKSKSATRETRRHKNESCDVTLKNFIDTIPCFKEWAFQSYIAVGSVGTVLGVCKNKNTKECAAMKLQTGSLKDIDVETRIQAKAGALGIAPKIHDICDFTHSDQVFSVIIMDKIDGTLDDWLVAKRSGLELEDCRNQLITLLQTFHKNGLTHGDLALFNIGYKKHANGSVKFVLIDFDRSSDTYKDTKSMKRIDYFRVLIELLCKERSANTKAINEDNAMYLGQLWQQSHELFDAKPNEIKTCAKAGSIWERLYEEFASKHSYIPSLYD